MLIFKYSFIITSFIRAAVYVVFAPHRDCRHSLDIGMIKEAAPVCRGSKWYDIQSFMLNTEIDCLSCTGFIFSRVLPQNPSIWAAAKGRLYITCFQNQKLKLCGANNSTTGVCQMFLTN
jgi:hypothetical protein